MEGKSAVVDATPPDATDRSPLEPGADAQTSGSQPDVIDDAWLDGEPLRLRPDVELIEGANGEPMLHDGASGDYTRLTSGGAQLVGLIDGSASGRELVDAVAERTDAATAQKVARFLTDLRTAGVLVGEHPAEEEQDDQQRITLVKRLPLVTSVDAAIDPIVERLKGLPSYVSRAVLAGAAAASLLAIVAVLTGRPPVTDLSLVWWPALVLFPVGIAVHEASHAVACRWQGVHVRNAGVGLMLYVLPIAYVDRTDAYRIRSRRGRAVISAVGPLVDLLLSGAAAAVVLTTTGTVAATAQILFYLWSAAFVFNLNPLLPTDGYYALEALSGGVNVRGRSLEWLKHRVRRRELPAHLRDISARQTALYLLLAFGSLAYLAWIAVGFVGRMT